MCIARSLLAKGGGKASVSEEATTIEAVSGIHFSVLGKGTGFILSLVTPIVYARQ